MTPHSLHSPCTWLVAAALLGCGAASANEPDRLRNTPLPALQRAYLACVVQSETRALSLGEAAGCSVVHEALKLRMFDGSFERLLAWTREQKLEQAGPQSALR